MGMPQASSFTCFTNSGPSQEDEEDASENDPANGSFEAAENRWSPHVVQLGPDCEHIVVEQMVTQIIYQIFVVLNIVVVQIVE